MKRVLHLSFADDSKGGGVFFYLKDLINIQKNYGIHCHWITIKSKNLRLKKEQILREILRIEPNIIHIHGVWHLGTRMIPQLKEITENIILSPHGMLNKESLRKSYLGRNFYLQYLKKQLYLLFFEKRNLQQVKGFHALTEAESKEIRRIFPGKYIKVIKSGFEEINSKVKFKANKNLKNIFQKPKKILLFMGRLDHQKGVIELINAWKKLVYEAEFYNWFLLIAGFGPLKKNVFLDANKFNSRIIFAGPKFGAEKMFILKNSKAFILPSYNEGLPVSVLEALSFGTTCLISQNCNMNDLIDSNISLKINITKNSNNIEEALMQLFQLSEEDLYKRENLGREYLEKYHKWDKIMDEFNFFYRDLYKN